MNVESTKTPWILGSMSDEILDSRGHAVAAPPDQAGDPELDQWRSDAVLIVQAVNTYDGLVGALRRIAFNDHTKSDAAAIAREALKLAGIA